MIRAMRKSACKLTLDENTSSTLYTCLIYNAHTNILQANAF